MVTVVPGKKSFGTRFGEALGPALKSGYENERGRIHEKELLQEKLGHDKEQKAADLATDNEAANAVGKVFGPNVKAIWPYLTEGGRSKATEYLLSNREANLDTNALFSDYLQNNPDALDQSKLEEEGLGDNTVDASPAGKPAVVKAKVPDYKLDLTGRKRSEQNDYKKDLRKDNTPIWKESRDRLKSYKELSRDVKILNNLNEKKNLPEGAAKLFINPETGAPYDRVAAVKDMHPDVQQWVKTIARQATQAQTAFPGRVTNFDLQSYMRQFPGLFNTYEGRKVILDQMNLVNQGNELFENALQDVYAKHKLDGITPEDAEDLAQQMVQGKLDNINEQIVNLSQQGEQLAGAGQGEQGKRVNVYDANGKVVGDIDPSEVSQLPQGYTAR